MSNDRPVKQMRTGLVRSIPRRGLAARLTWAFVLLAGALLLIVGIVLTLVSYNALRQQVIARQRKTAGEAALLTATHLTRALDTLSVYGEADSAQALLLHSLESQQESLNGILAKYPDLYQGLTLVDAEGDELAKVSRFRTYSVQELGSQADNPAYQQAIQGSPYVATEVSLPADSSFPAFEIAAPMRGRTSLGVLLADVSVEGMWDAVAQVEVGETGYAYIVDRDTGQIIAHSDPARYTALQGQSLDLVPVVRQLTAGESDVEPQYRGLEGQQVIGAASALPGTNWALVVELPTAEAMADVRQMLYLLAVLLVVGVLIAGSLGLLVPRRIIQPLHVLQEGAKEIEAGHLDHVIEVRTGDELQDLGEAFNEMAVALRSSRIELERWGHELEDRVEERTAELAAATERMRRRALQIQTSAEVARAIASVRDLNKLLSQVTHLISERFGWYHVGIFLVDERREYAVLEATNSEGGQRMLARSHRLKIGEVGIVGTVTSTGEPLIALDVGEDAVYFDNPDLPDTRSEMALPLKIGDRIIGALDMQSTKEAAYDDEDLAISSNLADQVAIAIENASLFEETQHALEEVRALQRRYVERAWARGVTSRRDMTYEYRRRGTPPLADTSLPEAAMAMTQGDVVAVPDYASVLGAGDDGGSEDAKPRARAALAAPIKIRDQVIGVLDLQETDEARQWTEDDIALVRAISDQVGQALETARLFEETSRRAEQMATLNRIGLDLAAGLEVERVLQSLYEQCQQVLVTDAFYVALYSESTGMIEFPLLTGPDGPVHLEPLDIRREPSLTSYIIESGEPLHIADTHTVPEDAPYRALQISNLPNRSYIGVPLLARGRVMGVLSVQGREPHTYSDEDLELLTTIATQASIAIENARSYERMLETADELRELDRLKMQFLANMSHELRTPLNSIIGFARVMLKGIDGPLTDLQEADLTSIYNSGQHLLSLINSILDMSKIEAGKMDLTFEEVPLPDVIDGALSVAKALIKDKPIELLSVVPDTLPTVWADAQRVRQILLNLLSNATKFTEEGQIVLQAEPGPEFVTITVRDTGVGIDPEAQNRIFIAFQQVDGSTTRRAEGTGLGLAISRSFVEMHGGQIWVDSEPDRGSTFSFTLPVYQAVREREKEASELYLEPDKKVLLAVDDDAGVITLLNRYLEHDGYQVIGVTYSRQALEMAQRLAPNLTAITLDIVMPDLDGWQVLRSLKENPRTRDVPVILCSIVDGLEQGLRLGADACLRKPVTRDEILGVLERLERRVTRSG